MAITPQDIAQRAGEEAQNILGALPGLARDGAAQYVKIGTPPSLIPNVGLGIARQACRRYADNPGGVPGGVAAAFEGVCRPYLDDIGYGAPPAIELPFRGGQCLGVFYDANFLFTADNGSSQNFGFDFPGGGLIGVYIGPQQPNLLFPIGVQRLLNGSVNTLVFGSVADTGAANPRISNIRRQDGQPDNCGNPPPVVTQPGTPGTPPPTGPEPFSPGPGVDVDIDVTIGPTGDITFNIGGPNITIDPFGGGGGEGSGGDNPGIDQPGTAPSSGLPPGDIGQPSPPADTGEDGVAAGCAPPNSVLVGVKVNILEPFPKASEYDPLVRRGVCYVYMGTPSNLALVPEGVALRNGQMLFAPLDNLTCYEVRANVGYQLRVTPYYRALEPQEV